MPETPIAEILPGSLPRLRIAVRLRSQINEKDAEVKGLTSSIASTQQENDRLQSSIDALDTPEGLEQVARDQLGMVSEGEIVFEDVGDS